MVVKQLIANAIENLGLPKSLNAKKCMASQHISLVNLMMAYSLFRQQDFENFGARKIAKCDGFKMVHSVRLFRSRVHSDLYAVGYVRIWFQK